MEYFVRKRTENCHVLYVLCILAINHHDHLEIYAPRQAAWAKMDAKIDGHHWSIADKNSFARFSGRENGPSTV